MGNGAIYISALIFIFMALLHLARTLCHFPVIIGTVSIPYMASYAGFILFALLSGYLLRARHIRPR
jgi:hypothetical protein